MNRVVMKITGNKKIAEKTQVSISAMGNVQHTVFSTSGERVNGYAVGKAKNLRYGRKRGFARSLQKSFVYRVTD